MLLYQKFPPDIRVEKEAKSLIEAGNNIYLIALDKKEYIENIKGIKVIYLKNYIFDSFVFRFIFFRPLLARKLIKVVYHSFCKLHLGC